MKERVSSLRHLGRLATWLLIIVALAAIPLFVSSVYRLHIVTLAAINAICAMGLTFTMGFCGQLSLGHAALMATGAYTAGLLAVDYGMPFWVTLPASAAIGACFGFILGMPTLRLKTHYLAMATMGFNEILRLILTNWKSFTHGADGVLSIPAPAIGSLRAADGRSLYYVILIFALVVFFVSKRIEASRFGRSFKAVREKEIAAEVIGVNTHGTKVFAFMLSAAWAGLAGGLYAHFQGFIAPSDFTIGQSIVFVSMVVVGGSNSLAGTVVGATLFTLLPEYLRFLQQYSRLVYGIIIVLTMIVAPSGLAGILSGFRTRLAWAKLRGLLLKWNSKRVSS